MVYFGLHYSKIEFWEGICFVHFLPLSFLLGPSLFFYIKYTLSNNKAFQPIDLLHLFPAVFVAINCLPFTTLPLEVKTRMAHEIVNYTEDYRLNFWWATFEQLLYGRSIHVMLYAVLSIVYFFWNKRQVLKAFGVLPSNHVIIQRWFFSLLFLQVLIAGTSLGHMITLYFKPFLILGIPSVELFSESHFFRICGGGFFIQNFILFLYPKILYGNISYSVDLEEENTFQKIKSSIAKPLKNGIETLEITNAIQQYLVTTPFIKKDFTLSQMSFDLKITERVLSTYFNKELNKTFGEWKNDLRINYACNLIENGMAQKITIEAIASEVGFVSRSKFIDAFKERKGFTPSTYIKERKSTGA